MRQAVNYAIDRAALVKIFGGQGTPTETVLPPRFGTAYHEPNLYPHDVAKAKQLVAAGRRDGRVGADLDDERRPGAEGGAVPGERARARSA